MLVLPAEREIRSWVIDSRRWDRYRPRPDDIVISTYPKCGTTWMQRIVSLLVFKTPEPRPVMKISPWIERRFGPPLDAVLEEIEAQTDRRFLKAHLPRDAMPFFDEVKYIHVARDGRDACMSYQNHCTALTDEVLDRFDQIGRDDPAVGRLYPRPPSDPSEFFHRWITRGEVPGDADGCPMMSFFSFVRSWWDVRDRSNVLLVHYNDLKADLPGQMRRIATYLEIEVDEALWPTLVEAARFDAMRRDGEALMANLASIFRGGKETFFFKGTNGRWRDIISSEDLALYDAKVGAFLSPDCAEWVEKGALHGCSDPRGRFSNPASA
jgi:aryl sulfotransferase